MPEIKISHDIITADYYCLSPVYEKENDISILDYSIENGQSKLVLLNETDSSSYVKIEMDVHREDMHYSMSDTILTQHDVDGQYEEGYKKINTFYFDFLPALGNSNISIEILPINMIDSDTSNNKLVLNIYNNWINVENGHLSNNFSDTAYFSNFMINKIMISENSQFSGSVYVNNYHRNYDLSDFGASQSGQDILYVNSRSDDLDFQGAAPVSSLSDGEFYAFLSIDLDVFYRLPMETIDSMIIFPIQSSGYYVKASSIDNVDPDIELNINARELLSGGYVSARSDFSIIMTDDHGVNPLPEFWEILLDDEEIPDENVMIVDNNTLSQFEVNFKLNLDVGSHTLQVTTHDLVGNIKQTEKIDIRYTGESQLIDYGTYPNPFTTKTTFIYELTEQFDDVIIKIFTISGQKIFTMSVSENAITDLPLYSIGYHEIPWYGHDEFGNTVANGVYFYIIEGQVNDKKIKSTGKIAKLR
jgi:flagellar hook assembly protein FlgD